MQLRSAPAMLRDIEVVSTAELNLPGKAQGECKVMQSESHILFLICAIKVSTVLKMTWLSIMESGSVYFISRMQASVLPSHIIFSAITVAKHPRGIYDVELAGWTVIKLCPSELPSHFHSVMPHFLRVQDTLVLRTVAVVHQTWQVSVKSIDISERKIFLIKCYIFFTRSYNRIMYEVFSLQLENIKQSSNHWCFQYCVTFIEGCFMKMQCQVSI